MESGFRQLTEQDITTTSTSKQTQYGAQGVTADGRGFRYVGFSGTSTVAPGQLCIAAPYTTGAFGMAITATTVATGSVGQTTASLTAGSQFLVLTNSSSQAITQDQFAEGYLEVTQTSGTGNGPIVYSILGNTAAGAGNVTATYVVVYLRQTESLRNASVLVPGTDTGSIYANPYSAVAPSATAGQAVGVTVSQVLNTASITNYGWIQTIGTVWLTNDAGGNLTVGEGIAQSTTTAGDIVAQGATTYGIGQTQKAFNASTAGPCVINLD